MTVDASEIDALKLVLVLQHLVIIPTVVSFARSYVLRRMFEAIRARGWRLRS